MSSVKYYDIDEKGVETMKRIKDMLDNVKFQTSGNRKVLTHDFARPTSMPIGMKKELNGTYALPVFDKENPEIYPVIRDFVNTYAPDFDFNAGYVNRNVQMIPHKDKNNCDTSLIFAMGDFTDGRLYVEGTPFDIKYKLIEFDGKREEHWTEFFTGDRYSVVIYKI
tara:strand:+ start:47 stop:544 length:498 start_codon:yes stop_codon:yes gene_type:complete